MECSAFPELTLGEFAGGLLEQLQGRRHPLGCTLEITERCNHSCIHCYISQPAGKKQATKSELTLPQVQSIVDQLVDAECLWLLITGGEVLVRPDFLDIYMHAKRRGLLVSVFTNGTLLTPSVADYLAEWRPYSIEITLYGYTQQTYERVTGVPGSYERCMRGIDLLIDRRLPLSLKSVILAENRHELKEMKSFAESIGVDFRYDAMLWPRLDGCGGDQSFRLSPQEVVDLDVDDGDRRKAWGEFFEKFGGVPARAEYLYSCGAGVRSCHIDSYGRLSMCMLARQPSYDLLQGSFREGWDEFLGALRREKRKQHTPCETCELRGLCSQCPGWSQLAHGDDETVVDFVCEVAHLRSARMDLSPN